MRAGRRAILSVILGGMLAGPAWPQAHELTGELPSPGGQPPSVAARPTVLVAGATGRTGREVLRVLAEETGLAIRAMSRGAPPEDLAADGDIEWVRADVTMPETLVGALDGVEYVICTIGATERSGPNGPEFVDYGGVVNLTDAARQVQVRHFVLVSSMGAGGGGGFVAWILNLIGGDILEWKAKGEAYLRQSGVPYTIVRPGGLHDGAGGQTGIAVQQGDQGMGSIARADVATVLVAMLGNPSTLSTTFEIMTDDEAPVGAWRKALPGLQPD